jgi:hypothetical protein
VIARWLAAVMSSSHQQQVTRRAAGTVPVQRSSSSVRSSTVSDAAGRGAREDERGYPRACGSLGIAGGRIGGELGAVGSSERYGGDDDLAVYRSPAGRL